MDLETEFETIVNGVYRDIAARVTSGNLTQAQADALTSMVGQRLEGNSNNFDQESDLSGWNSSQVCW